MVYHGWEDKCWEILAAPNYSKIRGSKKDVMMMCILLHLHYDDYGQVEIACSFSLL